MEIIFDKDTILSKGKEYLKKFKNSIFVIKYGGSNLDNQQISDSILEDICYLFQNNIRIALVHGGGNAISKLMTKKGKTVEFIGGQRVTNEETALIVDEALCGVNCDIVKRIKSFGVNASSVISREHGVIKARKRDNALEEDFAGDIDSINTEPILSLMNKGTIPVISPVGIGQDNKLYNINADTAGAEIAIAIGARKLIFLTNVRGVMLNHIDENTLISTITEGQIEDMIRKNVISSGMIPKARSSIKALFAGVKKVHIISGKIKHSLLIEVLTDKGIGTEIVK